MYAFLNVFRFLYLFPEKVLSEKTCNNYSLIPIGDFNQISDLRTGCLGSAAIDHSDFYVVFTVHQRDSGCEVRGA